MRHIWIHEIFALCNKPGRLSQHLSSELIKTYLTVTSVLAKGSTSSVRISYEEFVGLPAKNILSINMKWCKHPVQIPGPYEKSVASDWGIDMNLKHSLNTAFKFKMKGALPLAKRLAAAPWCRTLVRKAPDALKNCDLSCAWKIICRMLWTMMGQIANIICWLWLTLNKLYLIHASLASLWNEGTHPMVATAALLSWYSITNVKSLQLQWRLGTSRWNLLVPNDLTKWTGASLAVLVPVPLTIIWSNLKFDPN